ncbi:Metallo-beta-lactamase family protein, RNA-specific [Nitrincola lacisaponensis]|uniref:Metallo-beta-lactamase family protein, RNA-specific n=1 Tax=Nitrincola lacisaponensis TaxID=267850 RepID=A0A063Y9Z9_9GAMM|nr:MBL fold metallo-hydrolase [Nitrincola lacisaponensis]KDE41162.1 Metallo-beta-lactamase family protein, RNA-specific [Nitrincola lacisaponensis]
MHILHHGGATGVTGSCHQLVTDSDASLLIDCGLFQGDEQTQNLSVDFPIESLNALILTHVHLDHVGRLPWLLAAGYDGPIYCSKPSAALLPLVLEDAFRLTFSRDAKRLSAYLDRVSRQLRPLDYKVWYPLYQTTQHQVRVRLQRAGHILGSAYVEIDVCHQHTRASRRVVFSGDLGARYTPLLPAPKSPYRADWLVLESTYGDRQHTGRSQRKARLREAIQRALRNQGTVLIPAFSMGRTQELLYELEEILHTYADKPVHDGLDWSQLPVILDSPLASKITECYRTLQPWWNEEAHQRLRQGRRPLAFEQLLKVESHDAHLRMLHHLASSARPAVVIAGSGMCQSGRIVNYLKRMLPDPRHAVLFVGYQASGTPGRHIQQYGPQGGYVDLDDARVDIRAQIDTLSGYSAHADQQGLVQFVKGMRHKPHTLHLVHGEVSARQALAGALRDQIPALNVTKIVT